ncbi:transcriptional regulator [Pasteurellaceae bacterium RH1A]|nr:transcriptional regulator [Pasteurellaceae bacterium RH1A]
MEIHEKIRVFREIYQLSQEDMAEKMDMSANGYAKIERGQTKLNVEKLQQIANIFQIELTDLISDKSKPSFWLIGDNSNNYSANYIGIEQEFVFEMEKLKLQLTHKDEVITKLNEQISSLREIISLLKGNQED